MCTKCASIGEHENKVLQEYALEKSEREREIEREGDEKRY
jgi:hypothetical protein